MPTDFLSGLGLAGQNPDYNTPLQSELSAALMKALTTQQMPYDPNIRGGWTSTMVNALRDINAGYYRDQALRTRQGMEQDLASKVGNQILGTNAGVPNATKVAGYKTGSINPAANQSIPDKLNQTPVPKTNQSTLQDLATTLMGGQTIDNAPPEDQNPDFTTVTKDPWAALTIKNGVDENAPYMKRLRDEANTKRIVFHGDVKDNVNDITDANGKVINQGLLNYGRQVDKGRGFDPNYHYYIDRDGTITNGVPTDRTANHVGKYNDDSIGIVLAGVVGGKQPTPAQVESATKLSQMLAEKYNLTQSNIIKHPELMPGHRTMDESGDVAPMIRKYGFDQSNWPAGPTEQNRIETAALPLNRKSIEQAKNVSLGASQPVEQLEPRTGKFSKIAMASQVTPPVDEIPDTGNRQDTLTRRDMNPAWNVKNEPVGTTTIPKRSNLGGPMPDEAAGGAQNFSNQVAQNFEAPKGLEKGNLPAVRQMETPQELRDLLHSPLIASDPQLMQQIIGGYLARQQAQTTKAPFGDIQTITGVRGQTAPQSRMLPTDREFQLSIAGMGVTGYPAVDPNTGQQGFKLKLPGPIGEKVFNSPDQAEGELKGLFDLARQGQQISAEGHGTQKLMEARTDNITNAVHEGSKAPEVLRTLDAMKALNTANPPRGPTKDFMLKMREFLGNAGLPVNESTAAGESFEKLNNFLSSQGVRAFTNRGTNFDLQTYMRAYPSLFQTKEGTDMLIDILRQDYETKQKIGQYANSLGPQDFNKLPDKINEIYRDNPIKFTLQGHRFNTLPLRPGHKEEDYARILPGEIYINPAGKRKIKSE